MFAGFGSKRNLLIITLFSDGSFISLYLFNIFIRAIFASKRARCFPIQVLGPPEKPRTTYGGRLLHSDSHLYGLKRWGSLKNLGLYWFGKLEVQTIVSFVIGISPSTWSCIEFLKMILGMGVPILKVYEITQSRYYSFLRLSYLISSSFWIWLSIKLLTFS